MLVMAKYREPVSEEWSNLSVVVHSACGILGDIIDASLHRKFAPNCRSGSFAI